MGRTRQVVVDQDNSWIIREELTLDPSSPIAPKDDYIVVQTGFPVYSSSQSFYTQIVIWGVGLVSFGPVTAAQITFMASLGANPDLSAFPGDYVAFGFSSQQLNHFQYGVKDGYVYVTSDINPMISITPDGIDVFGATAVGAYFGMDFGGFQSTSTSALNLFFADLTVTSGTIGNDTMNGTSGPETLNGLGGNDQLNGNLGADHLIGGGGRDILRGGAGNDRLEGQDGNDTLDGGAGDDRISGGSGIDTATYASASAGVDVDLSGQGVAFGSATGGAGNDTLTGIENVTGSNFADSIYGDDFANALSGLAGNDFILGGNGNDVINGGAGDDQLNGGDQIDTVSYSTATSGVSVSLATTATQNTGGAGMDTLSNFENITGSAYADRLTGNSNANLLSGGNGDDILLGGAGNDILSGGAGADTLSGGAGGDRLTGGSGTDKFTFDTVLSATTNLDTITDFSVVDDTIVLDHTIFTQIGIGALTSSGFFAGTGAHDADDRIIYDRATGKIYYDADGSGAAAQTLFAQLGAGTVLTNADFLIVS